MRKKDMAPVIEALPHYLFDELRAEPEEGLLEAMLYKFDHAWWEPRGKGPEIFMLLDTAAPTYPRLKAILDKKPGKCPWSTPAGKVNVPCLNRGLVLERGRRYEVIQLVSSREQNLWGQLFPGG